MLKILISVQVLSDVSVENNPFLESLGAGRCRNTFTHWRGFISQKKGVLNHTTVESRLGTVVKVCRDLYESLRENVLKKIGLSYGNVHNHGRARSFFLIVYMWCAKWRKMRKAKSYFRRFPDDMTILDKVDVTDDDWFNSGRCALCHCSPNALGVEPVWFWN